MAWQTEVRKLMKRFNCEWAAAKAIRESLAQGVSEADAVKAAIGKKAPAAKSTRKKVREAVEALGELAISQETNSPVTLIEAAQSLVLAAGGDVARARQAIDAYESLKAPEAPKVEPAVGVQG